MSKKALSYGFDLRQSACLACRVDRSPKTYLGFLILARLPVFVLVDKDAIQTGGYGLVFRLQEKFPRVSTYTFYCLVAGLQVGRFLGSQSWKCHGQGVWGSNGTCGPPC